MKNSLLKLQVLTILSATRKKRIVTTFAAAVFFSANSYADVADTTNAIAKKNSIYVECSGEANSHSVNYMHTFRAGKKWNYSYSVGYAPLGENFSFPLSFNAYTTGQAHHLVLSAGVIPYVEHHLYNHKIYDSDKQAVLTQGVGYMYQKAAKGIFFKATAASQMVVDPAVRAGKLIYTTFSILKPTAGVALGLSF